MQSVSAQSIEEEAAFQAVWSAFKTALLRGDKEAVASIAAYPFDGYAHLGKAGNIRTPKRFVELYDSLLTPQIQTALVSHPPFYNELTGGFELEFDYTLEVWQQDDLDQDATEVVKYAVVFEKVYAPRSPVGAFKCVAIGEVNED